MPDPWSVVATKPAGGMPPPPPGNPPSGDPWAVVSHQPAQQSLGDKIVNAAKTMMFGSSDSEPAQAPPVSGNGAGYNPPAGENLQRAKKLPFQSGTSMSAGTKQYTPPIDPYAAAQPNTVKSFVSSAGLPTNQPETTTMVRGLLNPQADPNEQSKLVRMEEQIPVLGSDFRARAELAKRGDNFDAAIPLFGPANAAFAEKAQQGDYTGAAGAALNALFSLEGMKTAVAPGIRTMTGAPNPEVMRPPATADINQPARAPSGAGTYNGPPIDRTISTPESAPPRGITSQSSFVPDLKAKAGAVAKVAGQDLFAHVPVVGRVVQRPSFADYVTALKTKADPQLDLFNNTPKLGDSPLFSTAADPLMPASLKPEEPAPAPYRLRGNQIQDATTVTPREIIGPERQLAAAPDATAQPPRGITQGKTPYVPGAVMEPAPFLTMHGAESGETAALMQLTHTGGQALRRIAQARGLKIPAAADNISIIQKIHDDLSPEEIQSFADAAKARAQERATSLEGVDPAIVSDNRAIAQKLYDKADEMQAAGESPYKIKAWRTAGESIETRPTPVKDILGDTDALKTIRGVDSRMAQHIQEVTGSGQPQTPAPIPPSGTPPQAAPAAAAPPRGITQAQPVPPEAAAPKITKAMVTENGTQMYRVAYPDGRLSIIPETMLNTVTQGTESPKPQLATEANTEDLLRQSLAQRGITQPQARAAAAGASPPGQSPVSTSPPVGGFSVASRNLPSDFRISAEESINGTDLAMKDAKGNQMGTVGIRSADLIPGKNVSEVGDIKLQPEYQGKGYGQALYEKAAAHARDAGDDFLVSSGSPTAAAKAAWQKLQAAHPGEISFSDGRFRWDLSGKQAPAVPRGITQPIDLNAPPEQRIMPPEVTARADYSGQTVPAKAPTFFSKAEQVAEEKLPNSVKADQVIPTLQNAGVKAEELKWLGLDDYLKGKDKVSKADLLDHIRENNLQVNEVTKGEPKFNARSKYAIPEIKRAAAQAGSTPGDLLLTIANDGDTYRALTKKFPELSGDEDWAEKVVKDVYGTDTKDTKFGQYQLPGGENYRELLLTLPNAGKSAARTAWESYKQELFNKYGTQSQIDLSHKATPQEMSKLQDLGDRMEASGKQFNSPHFDEPNVLAHVRFNDRTAPDGSKTLFVEEVQSDWHQKGRREGYKVSPDEVSKLEARRDEIENLGKNATPEQRQEWADIKNKLVRQNVTAVPDAPFKSTWHELAMKRMLRYAAENGYDRLAWTTGEQQAARYDLSKQVDAVRVSGDPAQGLVVEAAPKGQGYGNIATDVKPEKLADYIGKELAQKAIDHLNSKPGAAEFKGIDLKVGGQGMAGFYDKILPDFMNKYGKKWGAKVGETQLPTSGLDKPVDDGAGGLVRGGKSGYKSEPVHSIDITPAMRKDVIFKGQPIAKSNPPRGITAPPSFRGITSDNSMSA